MALHLWQLWCIIGILFFITELFTPVMFFLNLGLACFAAAVAAEFGLPIYFQVLVFAIFSAIFLIWLRPILIKTKRTNDTEFCTSYIGKSAKVVDTITEDAGRIALYGEEWQAKSIDNSVIEKGAHVKIIRNESIIMFVEALQESPDEQNNQE